MKSVLFELAGAEKSLTLTTGEGPQLVTPGFGELKEGSIAHPQFGQQVMASTGAWTAPDNYCLRMYLYQTPFYLTMNFKFTGDEVVVNSEMNVSFGPSGFPPVKGVAR
jgi:hypothetical protein